MLAYGCRFWWYCTVSFQNKKCAYIILSISLERKCGHHIIVELWNDWDSWICQPVLHSSLFVLQALIDLQWPSERGCFRWFTLIYPFSSPHKSAVFAPLITCVFPFSPLTLSAVVLQNRAVQALLVGDSCRPNYRLKTDTITLESDVKVTWHVAR